MILQTHPAKPLFLFPMMDERKRRGGKCKEGLFISLSQRFLSVSFYSNTVHFGDCYKYN
jgi:hypothetical protein